MLKYLMIASLIGFLSADIAMIERAIETKSYSKALWLAKEEIYATGEENSELYYMLGNAYAGLNRQNLADASFKKFFTFPFDKQYAYSIAEYYEKREEYGKATSAYANIIKSHPTEYRASLALGRMHFNQKQYQMTIDLLGEYYKDAQKDKGLLSYYMGLSYYGLKDVKNAEKYLIAAVEFGYEGSSIHLALGEIYVNQKQYQKGIDELLVGIRSSLEPVDKHIYFSLGRAYSDLNNPLQAEDAYRKAIEMGLRGSLFVRFAQSAEKNGNFQTIVDTLLPYEGENEQDGEFLYYLGLGYENTNQADMAISTYQKSLLAGSDDEDLIREKIGRLGAQ